MLGALEAFFKLVLLYYIIAKFSEVAPSISQICSILRWGPEGFFPQYCQSYRLRRSPSLSTYAAHYQNLLLFHDIPHTYECYKSHESNNENSTDAKASFLGVSVEFSFCGKTFGTNVMLLKALLCNPSIVVRRSAFLATRKEEEDGTMVRYRDPNKAFQLLCLPKRCQQASVKCWSMKQGGSAAFSAYWSRIVVPRTEGGNQSLCVVQPYR